MKRIFPMMFVLCLGVASNISAQTDVNKDIDVATVYEQVVKEGYGTPAVYLKLANEHYFKSNYTAAKKWFEKTFETEKIKDKVVLFRYKQTLKALDLNFEGNKYIALASTH